MPETWDWNRWPARALDEVRDMFLRSVMDVIHSVEARRQRPSSIHLGAGASRFWQARHDRLSRRDIEHGIAAEIDRIYGLSVFHDRLIDRTIQGVGQFDSEIRIVSDGFGSDAIRMRAMNEPERARFTVEFRAANFAQNRHFAYAMFEHQYGSQPSQAPEPTRANSDHESRIRDLRGLLGGRITPPTTPTRPGPIPVARPAMSDLMIAWNT